MCIVWCRKICPSTTGAPLAIAANLWLEEGLADALLWPVCYLDDLPAASPSVYCTTIMPRVLVHKGVQDLYHQQFVCWTGCYRQLEARAVQVDIFPLSASQGCDSWPGAESEHVWEFPKTRGPNTDPKVAGLLLQRQPEKDP